MITNNLAKFAILASLLAPLPALAAGSAEVTRDGVAYRYTVTEKGEMQRISGTSSEGSAYMLVVAHGRVSGTVDGHPVSFRLSDVKPTGNNSQVAAR